MNEPKVNLRQVSTRIDIEDYARVIQVLADGKHKDISEYVRTLIHDSVAGVELSDEHREWRDNEIRLAAEKRKAKRSKRRSFIVRIFGGK